MILSPLSWITYACILLVFLINFFHYFLTTKSFMILPIEEFTRSSALISLLFHLSLPTVFGCFSFVLLVIYDVVILPLDIIISNKILILSAVFIGSEKFTYFQLLLHDLFQWRVKKNAMDRKIVRLPVTLCWARPVFTQIYLKPINVVLVT